MKTSDKHLAQNVVKVSLARRLLGEVFTTEPAEKTRDAIMQPLRDLELQLLQRLKDNTK